MSANDNAPAEEYAYTLTISDDNESASIGFHSAAYVSPRTYANDFIAAYDLISQSGMNFDDLASLISAASRIPGGHIPLYAMQINPDDILTKMFTGHPLVEQAETPAQGLASVREKYPSLVEGAHIAAAAAIKCLGELLSAKLTSDGSSKVH